MTETLTEGSHAGLDMKSGLRVSCSGSEWWRAILVRAVLVRWGNWAGVICWMVGRAGGVGCEQVRGSRMRSLVQGRCGAGGKNRELGKKLLMSFGNRVGRRMVSQGWWIWCERRKSDGENECCGGGIWLWFRCGLSGLK